MLAELKEEEVLGMIKNGFVTNDMAESMLYGAKLSLDLRQITYLVNSSRAQAVEEFMRSEGRKDQPY